MILPNTLREIILKSGFVSPADFDEAVKTSNELGKTITDVLVYRGLISEEAMGQLVAQHYKVPYINLTHKTASKEALASIPEEAANAFHMFPFSIENGVLHLALEDPSDIEAKEFAKRKTGLNLKIYYAITPDMTRSLGQYKHNIKEVFTKIIEENIQKNVSKKEAVEQAEDLPVIKILDTILEYAVVEGASDVHFEALELVFLIRFRIDGILHDILEMPKSIHQAIVARIKILSQLKIDEHRIPQDGRFKIKIKENIIAFRVSILPAFYGENIVLRILPETARPLSLEELGVTGHNLELVKTSIKKPHGMILVTGPTGSGKTTTLYSILTILNTTDVKITTVEDPVEYGIRRVNQIQINPAAGLTFATGMRSLLRHDPDIVMVGEIRDKETAEMAIQSALTGHLVLSTLHTNDASSTIPRFLDMGAEGFLVASTVNLVVAQRLVRKICTNCIESYKPSEELIKYLSSFIDAKNAGQNFYRGKGCNECGMKGYKGRIGIYECLEVNEEIRQLIVKRTSAEEINKAALGNKMIPLLQDGINKASGGITTIEEVLRVVRE
ncbi:MAG: Type 4 fimbrial assembly protein PilB [Candidatus Gottesmanbacteria bacterium GW2011_GWA1_34_13]|uniref:Type 4 fimbrial assembly protein PilB n=1 Tax=Candidatus Gottesmanbacteria bacterium GW2011_GWA1_34_13 TaxID=1618434 RepID=A0A0G0B824_9BACT|nr:MAG: Type 4 fimbrial assembly protein PilB [Candidatus Gottesmanbacteria bacterium GW2011_GWA1_34_13]